VSGHLGVGFTGEIAGETTGCGALILIAAGTGTSPAAHHGDDITISGTVPWRDRLGGYRHRERPDSPEPVRS